MREALLNTGTLLQTLKVSLAVLVLGKIEFELCTAAEAPEKMRVRGREVVEEIITASEQIVGDFDNFHRVDPRPTFSRSHPRLARHRPEVVH